MFRTIILSSLFAVLTFGTQAQAQTDQDTFEVLFQARETQRRALVSKLMAFSDDESSKFWVVYDNYRSESKQFQLRRINMLKRLSESLVGMTNATANEMVKAALKLENNQTQAKGKFISKVKKIVPGARFFRYYQLETKLDALFTYGWTKKIPIAITDEEAQKLSSDFGTQL